MKIKAVGIDAAFANMGFARVVIDTSLINAVPGQSISCEGLAVVKTEIEDRKVVRRSSDRLRRAHELRAALVKACEGAQFAFVEVPSGTQNASAAFGLGIAVGVLASCPIPIIEVSPMEVKAIIAGHRVKKGASKAEVITWASAMWPQAPWERATAAGRSKGKVLPRGRLLASNEHAADALATVAAGVKTPEFLRLMQLVTTQAPATVYLQHAIASPTIHRPALRRVVIHELPLATVAVARRTVLY